MSDKKKIVWLFKTKRKVRDEYASSTIWNYGILENLGYEVVYHPYEDYNADEFYQLIKDYKPEPCGKYRFGDTRHICSDISKLKSLGWSPSRTVYDSVIEYKEWLDQADRIDDIVEYCNEKMKKLNVVRDVS